MAETITFAYTESGETITVTLNENARGPAGATGPAPSGTGLVSVTAGVLDSSTTLSARVAADASNLRTQLGLGTASTKNTGTAAGNVPVIDESYTLNLANPGSGNAMTISSVDGTAVYATSTNGPGIESQSSTGTAFYGTSTTGNGAYINGATAGAFLLASSGTGAFIKTTSGTYHAEFGLVDEARAVVSRSGNGYGWVNASNVLLGSILPPASGSGYTYTSPSASGTLALTADYSQNGGASKIPQFNSDGDLIFSNPASSGGALGLGGNIKLAPFRKLIMMNADGTESGSIYLWDGHSGGDEIIYSSTRHCFYWTGGFQFGSPATARDGRFIYFQPNSASAADTLVEGVPVAFDNHYWDGAADAGNSVILQSVPLTTTAGGDVFRVNMGGTIDANHRVTGGTTAGEFSRTGLNHPGTNPSFTTLTDGATITWTVSKYLNTQHASVTLAGNRTLAFSGMIAGMNGRLVVAQDSTGSRTLTLPSGSKTATNGLGIISLSSAANSVDVLEWFYDGSNYFWKIAGTNFTAAYDTDAAAFIAAASITDDTQEAAINQLTISLKNSNVAGTGSLWSKAIAIWPFVGGNATAHVKNLKSANHGTISGTISHSANGITGNIAGSGIFKGLAFTSGDRNSACVYVYSKTASLTAGEALFQAQMISPYYKFGITVNVAATGTYAQGVMGTGSNLVNTTTSGFQHHFALNRSSSTQYEKYTDSTQTIGTQTSSGDVTCAMGFLANNNNNGTTDSYCSANLAFGWQSSSLTAAEIAALQSIVTTYQTSLGRQN